jgi:hypothetical protein
MTRARSVTIAAIAFLSSAVAATSQPLVSGAVPSWIKPDELTPEERALLDKDAIMQMYRTDEHSRHFVTQISKTSDGKNATPVLCFVFGMEDAEPARKEGESMAESHYSRSQAHEFLFAQGWDKYHDRFFTRCYVQEGENAFDKALKRKPELRKSSPTRRESGSSEG